MILIDVDAFRRELDNHWPFTKDEQSKHGIADMAKSTLLAVLNNNAVPVVRCRECVHYIKHDKRCGIWNHGGIVPYGFCFLGERRQE